jgi:hypothetical protein
LPGSTRFSGKSQAVDIIGLISLLMQEKNVIKHRSDPGERDLSGSHNLSAIGFPLNRS